MSQTDIRYEDVLEACKRYVETEQGDTNYEVAKTWVDMHWGDPVKVAGGIRIIEETWNRAFYAFGIFNMKALEDALDANWGRLDALRSRDITTYDTGDDEQTKVLWGELFRALMPMKRRTGPYVATAKALHLLAPGFFVPFDNAIFKNCGCTASQPAGYVEFQHKMSRLAQQILTDFTSKHGGSSEQAIKTICARLYTQKTGSHYEKTLAKILDEYN